jgi:hypothetical protein
MMTVRQLIEALSRVPNQNAEVAVGTFVCDYHDRQRGVGHSEECSIARVDVGETRVSIQTGAAATS